MSSPDSMFLLEITVEDLKSLISCRQFCIKSQFADIFSVHLKDPNEWGTYIRSKPIKPKRKTKVRKGNPIGKPPSMSKVQTGQSVLFANTTDNLIDNMRQYPIELSLWSKILPDYKLGSTHIPWHESFFEYLNKLQKKQAPQSVCIIEDYNVFDEFSSKRMAVITLNIKLTYLNDYKTNTPQVEPSSEENQSTYVYSKKPTSTLRVIAEKPIKIGKEITEVKTIFNSEKPIQESRNQETKKVKRISRERNTKKETKPIEVQLETKKSASNLEIIQLNTEYRKRKVNQSIAHLIKSETNFTESKLIDLTKSKSYSSIVKGRFNVLNYVFGSNTGPFGNQVYCVGYFTVKNDTGESASSAKYSDSPKSGSSPKRTGSPNSTKSTEGLASAESEKSGVTDKSDGKAKFKFTICKNDCPNKTMERRLCTPSICSLDLPSDAAHLITMKKCDRIQCNNRKFRKLPPPPDNRILLDLSNLKNKCCEITGKVEEVVGGMKAKMKMGNDPCYCECECTFGFVKKTTYCNICGGYEIVGEDQARTPASNMPFPCPIYHKLADKSKLKGVSTSASDAKKKEAKKAPVPTGDKIAESEVDYERPSTASKKKKKKKKKGDRFKFNYGYAGIPPMIGHDQCLFDGVCDVPADMGWLWNAEDIPGLKYRPQWKPGAAKKHIVRLLKMAKNPGETMAKKRKRDSGKVKRPLKRPLLTVHKKDGEYTVTMETMKTYSKPRTFNQYPYEDKPLVTYTIGRTEEENRERMKKKERARRRLERLQREFIQSAFKDMCEDICLKTYQQALGILPDAERPDCPCYPAEPGPDRTDLDHSCSCSEDKSLTDTETDSDEWLIEFTPPNATYDPTYKGKRVTTADATTQYTYLDYRVKLLDRYGNPVPRFFKGPDGKQQCSDLGGFWDPNHKWLEINNDGYIGPDERWAPNVFIGPNDEHVEAEAGKFQAMNGKWLVVGVDGYVDAQGKWKFYSKPKVATEGKKRRSVAGKKTTKDEKGITKPSEATWSCFGSASPKQLSKMGIVGHGHDKKILLSALKDLLAQGEDVKIPEPSTVPRSGKKVKKYRNPLLESGDRRKCKHATPSDKGIIAVDGYGHKTYFRLKDYGNKRPNQRLATLTDQGISLSSFHVPCFHSFISHEIMKKQQYERLLALSKGANANHKCTTTSHDHLAADKYNKYPSVLV